jgi:hypothetical protein
MTYTTLPNQTLCDVALMATGTLETLFAIATANGLSVSDDVAPGATLQLPPGLGANTQVLASLAMKKTILSTRGYSGPTSTFTNEFNDSFN